MQTILLRSQFEGLNHCTIHPAKHLEGPVAESFWNYRSTYELFGPNPKANPAIPRVANTPVT